MTEFDLAVKEPTTATPPRAPGSARRSSHVDVIPIPAPGVTAEEGTRFVLRGGARDVQTGADGSGVVVEAAELVVWIGRDGLISHLEVTPDLPGASSLVGIAPMVGFRHAARALLDGADGAHGADGLLALLLDDIPIAMLLSGYGLLRAGQLTKLPVTAGDPAGRMRDLCSGWRSDGTMIRGIELGTGVPVPHLADAPDLGCSDDPLAVQSLPDLPLGALRRRRRIDALRGDPVIIEATFRDTFRAAEREGTLHEYVVRATADGAGRIATMTAEPRVLPWPECPAAATNVAGLVGAHLGGLGRRVPATLTGTSACTHLNDLLRGLSCVPRLVKLAAGD